MAEMVAINSARHYLRRLVEEDLRPGEAVPPERDLAVELSISRDSVRKIFQELREEGLIRQIQGQGTFVSGPKIALEVTSLTSFTEGMRLGGLEPAAEVLVAETVRATPRLSEQLRVPVKNPVVHVVRKRLADGLPVALEDSYFPFDLVPSLLERDLAKYSIYELMDREFGVKPVRAVQTLDAVGAGQFQSAVLDVRLRAPLIRVSRLAFDAEDRAVEFARDLYRTDRVQFVAHSQR